MENGVPKDIEVTVTFLEMHSPPAASPPLPYNRQIALLKHAAANARATKSVDVRSIGTSGCFTDSPQ